VSIDKGDCVTYGMLQKYYSALKSLDGFSSTNDVFDNISLLDSFFSEFRNITFIAQKSLSDIGAREEYEKIRDLHLSGSNMRWFVQKRNETTKQEPFRLIKQIEFDFYLVSGKFHYFDDNLAYDYDEKFDIAKQFVIETLVKKFGLIEVFFSSHIVFKEDGNEVDIYHLILNGIDNMNNFINDIMHFTKCTCGRCSILKSRIQDKRINIRIKEMTFNHDYWFENGQINSVSDDINIMALNIDGNVKLVSEIRLPIGSEFWGDSKCIVSLFRKFIQLHVLIFQKAKESFMPVFMVLYTDDTYELKPFYAPSKATFYRMVYHLTDTLKFEDIRAIFYCGEYYSYNFDKLEQIGKLTYSDRVQLNDSLLLSFVCINNNGKYSQVDFESERIDDMEYIFRIIKQIKQSSDDFYQINWLIPLVNKFKETQI
jgi:hypothetical protein